MEDQDELEEGFDSQKLYNGPDGYVEETRKLEESDSDFLE